MFTLNWIAHLFFYVALLSSYYILTADAEASIKYYTSAQQIENIIQAHIECQDRIEEATPSHNFSDGIEYCPMNFDGAVCWPRTKANTTAVLQCPDYINKFDTSENVHRYCTPHGNWSYDAEAMLPRVDYRRCKKAAKVMDSAMAIASGDEIDMPLSHVVASHIDRIRDIYTVGYSISVTSLTVALIIMLLLRRLHCPRNTIHMNMFVSFILRGGIQLLRELLFDRNANDSAAAPVRTSLSIDISNSLGMEEAIVTDNGDWQCKLLSTVWMYTRLSNCVWIFMEGFYLYTLIFINTFSDTSGIKWFILTGWGSPLLFVIPWMLVRRYLDDYKCWDITPYKNKKAYRWIIEVPIVLLILGSFIFFLIIIRLLFTKLKASESSSRERRVYRKLAKSTLVLIPLFGVHYVVFLFAEFFDKDETLELIRFYFDTIFTSFQGLMVGILFFFMNGEVRTEIIKKWKRWRMLRNMKLPPTSTHLNVTQRTSIASEMDSLTTNRNQARQPSIQSTNLALSSSIREESSLLLSVDDNQNKIKSQGTKRAG